MDAQATIPPILTPEQKNHFNWLRTLTIGFGVVSIGIAIAVGGYFLGIKKSQPVQTNMSNYVSISPTAVQPNDASSETANWKTYPHPIIKYSVRYPSDWAYAEDKNSVQFFPPGTNLESNIVVDLVEIIPAEGLEFNAKVTEDTIITVAGQTVKKKMGTEIISDIGTIIQVGPITLNERNYFIVYTSGSHQANQQNIQIFDQILSTFKFTP